jgi:hypothetical protein
MLQKVHMLQKAQEAAVVPKTTVALSGVAAAVIYIVPHGKTFTGHLVGSGTAREYNINNTFSGALTIPIGAVVPLELQGGDYVWTDTNSTDISLVGVVQ